MNRLPDTSQRGNGRSRHGAAIFCVLDIILVLSGWFCPAAAASDRQTKLLSKFRYTRQAQLPEAAALTPGANLAIRLDSDFYSLIEDLNNGLRIVNADGKLVPFVLSKATDSVDITTQQLLPGKIVREQTLPDGSYAIDFELQLPAAKVCTVELVGLQTADKPQISIAVGDGRNWQTAIPAMFLSDIAQWPEITTRVFPFPREMAGKFVRVILPQGRYTRLEAIRVYAPQVKRQPEIALQTDYEISEIDRTTQQNTQQITYQSNNMPLTQIHFRTDSKFFLAKVTIQGSNDRQNWSFIAGGTIHRIDLDDAVTVDFPESRFQYIRIRVTADQAGESLLGINVRAKGNIYDWVLPVTPDTQQNLTIYYGANTTIPAQPRLLLASGSAKYFYNLSERQNNKLYKTGVRDRRNWRYMAGALLILAAGITMLVIFCRIKHCKDVLPAD